MKVSYDWLKDYVDVKMPAEKLAQALTMSGIAVDSVKKAANDHILEVEITSNRPDCLSLVGIGREVAAITGSKLKIPSVPKKPNTQYSLACMSQKPGQAIRNTISIKVEDKILCPRYTARIIRNVKIKESPEWLKRRIETMGLKPINNIVDITNFCLFETGEPMHAFDLDKISDSEVLIRRAKRRERITTIDGIGRILDNSDLIIADKDKPIAIAGIMGGTDTEVKSSTENILLEAACFDPISVRRTSRRLGLSTESSYRFERKVDLENIVYSSNRAAELMVKIAGGRIEELYDIGKSKADGVLVTLSFSRLNKMIGLDIPQSGVKKILRALGLEPKKISEDKLKLKIPHHRQDLSKEIDIIEEIIRIYGYDKVPKTMPAMVEQPAIRPFDMVVRNRICKILVGLGLDEIITYSLLGKKLLHLAKIQNSGVIEIGNPLSNEQEVMRPSLIVGMLNTICWNINRKTKDLKLFELGNIYIKEADGRFIEEKRLSVGMTGQAQVSWLAGSRQTNLFDLKGVCENLLSGLGIDSVSLREAKDERFSPSAALTIEIKGEKVGILGEVKSLVLANFDLKDKVYVLELSIDPLIKYVKLEKVFKELPKYPSASRDISIVVGKEVSNEDIVSAIKETAGPILKGTQLIDRYIGRQIPDGKIGLTYSLEYQDFKKTLDEKEVSELHSKVTRALGDRFGASLR